MVRKLLMLAVCAFLVEGCTPKVDFSEVSPKIADFHPKSVVVLPFTNSIGMESANQATNAKVVGDLQKSGRFDSIVEPAKVKQMMVSNPKVLDVLTRYRTTWTAAGICDPKVSAWLGQAFHADSIVFGEVTSWSEETTYNHHIYTSGAALRWVDAASGEVFWKASETYQLLAGNPCIFDCSNPDHAMDLAMQILFDNMPAAGTTAPAK